MALATDWATQHLDFLETDAADASTKLRRLIESEYRRRLARYQHTVHMLEQKYGMAFDQFEAQHMVEQRGYSWEVESDAQEWEMALDGIVSLEGQLAKLLETG